MNMQAKSLVFHGIKYPEKFFKIFFKKLLTNRRKWCIIPYVAVQQYCDTREWRNWQTRTFEGRVVYTVRVQVPFLAPKASLVLAFI